MRSPIRVVQDWQRVRTRVAEIETALATLAIQRPGVTGIDLDLRDPIDARAIEVLIAPRGGRKSRYTISTVSRMGESFVTIGYDEAFGMTGHIAEARVSGVVVAGGTDMAHRWIDRRDRAARAGIFGA